MRRKETRPTFIYWLVDIRPETIAAGWKTGLPFYCGKTVHTVNGRLARHKAKSLTRPNRPVSKAIRECGDFVAIQVMETVSPADDWIARERHWITVIRLLYPNSVNVSDGGDGAAGMIYGPEFRKKVSAGLSGKKLSPEHRANMSAAMKIKMQCPMYRAKLLAAAAKRCEERGPPSLETRAKMSAANKGKVRSAEHCARQSERNKILFSTPEMRAKLSANALAMWARRRALQL